MTMYYLDKIESKNSSSVKELSDAINIANESCKKALRRKHENTPKENLKNCQEYLTDLVASYDKYLRILRNIVTYGTIPEKIKYRGRRAKYEEEKKQIVNSILVPINKIIEIIYQKSENRDENLLIALWTMFYLTTGKSKLKEDKIFPEEDVDFIMNILDGIEKEIYKIKLSREEDLEYIEEFKENLDKDEKTGKVDDSIVRILKDAINSILKTVSRESRSYDKAPEISKKYEYKKKNFKDNSFIESYNALSDYSKKEFAIGSIDLEKYRILLKRKEIIELIIEGLSSSKKALEQESFIINNKKEKQRIKVIEMMKSALLTFNNMLKDLDKEIAEIEKYADKVAEAYKIETVLVEELATLLFKRKINEPYDEKRLEELLNKIKGQNYDKARSLYEKKYEEYRNKKELEEYRKKPEIKVDTDTEKLYKMTIEELERELRFIGGDGAVEKALSYARYQKSKIPERIDESRLPFDVYDLNLDKKNEEYKKSYREELIRMIEAIRSQEEKTKEAEKENAEKLKYDYQQLSRVVEILKTVRFNTRPSTAKIYRSDQYPDYLPNINIDEILKNPSYQKEIIQFLTPEEQKETLRDFLRRISEYLDLCVEVGLVKKESKSKAAKIMYEDLYMAVLVERAITKCKEIYIQNKEDLGDFSL